MLRRYIFADKNPEVSVILSTYNWSQALKISLTSALQQTLKNIEIIVVGDGCTDDSEEIVKSFRDRRIRWINLPKNTGSQSIPNKTGILNARADYIAYLGQDDFWHPTHLKYLLDTIQNKQADYAFSSAILYGPPDTDIRMVTGFPLKNDAQKVNHAIPPTTMMHTKALAEKIGSWRSNAEVEYAVDYDFQVRAHEANAVFVHTEKITAFKFPAAWYRDSYKKKDVALQTKLFQQMQNNPNFIFEQLVEVVKAAEHGSFVGTMKPLRVQKGYHYSINTVMKGIREPEMTNQAQDEIVYTLEEPMYGFEWQRLEQTQRGLSYRWSGPRTESTLLIPIKTVAAINMEIHVIDSMTSEIFNQLMLYVNDQKIEFVVHKKVEEGCILACHIPHDVVQMGSQNIIKVTFKVPHTVAPIEINPGSDGKRRLGIAVHSVACKVCTA